MVTIKQISEVTGVSENLLVGRKRTAPVCEARFIHFYLLYRFNGLTSYQIADFYHRNRTSVRHGIERVKELIAINDSKIKSQIKQLRELNNL